MVVAHTPGDTYEGQHMLIVNDPNCDVCVVATVQPDGHTKGPKEVIVDDSSANEEEPDVVAGDGKHCRLESTCSPYCGQNTDIVDQPEPSEAK